MKNDYWNKNYNIVISNGLDGFKLRKDSGTDWSRIEFTIHGKEESNFTFRDRNTIESLHFALGQLLEPDK